MSRKVSQCPGNNLEKSRWYNVDSDLADVIASE